MPHKFPSETDQAVPLTVIALRWSNSGQA